MQDVLLRAWEIDRRRVLERHETEMKEVPLVDLVLAKEARICMRHLGRAPPFV